MRKLDYMKLLLVEFDRRGWSHEEKMALLTFIEGIMHIKDKDAWDEWDEELEKRKDEGEMYVSLIERKGIKKGIEQGIEQEKSEMIREMLASGELEEKILRYARITRDELDKIRKDMKPTIN